MAKRKKVVVIGGGTGTSTVLSGLKKYPLDLTAIVTVTDDGGSTGRLRTEFGFLPVGDIRQCLAALINDPEQTYLQKLLTYRFDRGKGIKGHSLGNLILTALTDLTRSETKATEVLAKLFHLQGQIIPVTTSHIRLSARYQDGTIIIGEHRIDEPPHLGGKKITRLTLKPRAKIYPPAKRAILQADLIILGPGDLYTSLLPNLLVQGIDSALKQTSGRLIYIVNLMTRYSQTHQMTAQDHIKQVEKYLCRPLDFLFLNTDRIPAKILKLYAQEKGYPVKNDLPRKNHFRLIKKDFLAPELIVKSPGDKLQRSYLRHHPQKLAREIIKLLN